MTRIYARPVSTLKLVGHAATPDLARSVSAFRSRSGQAVFMQAPVEVNVVGKRVPRKCEVPV